MVAREVRHLLVPHPVVQEAAVQQHQQRALPGVAVDEAAVLGLEGIQL
ncbi:hypothetical protein OG978_38745 [Streptomyces sp. NBC_01591]|nr:hypothetical protein [Streptomyces sp. NBC_01591]WSD72799.1 hypothetical protein OG978_38745 [Streptomyces sp. NBC_01591]